MLEAISKNLRYYDYFRLFEMAQVFEKGVYHESSEDETLPIHKMLLTGCIVGKDPSRIFYELKGVLEKMAGYTQMEKIRLEVSKEKPSWADVNVYMDILLGKDVVGKLGLVSIRVMIEAKIKRTNVAVFELDTVLLVPNASRDNKFTHLSQVPLVSKDLSILVDEDVTWRSISTAIKNKVKEVKFIEEYRGNQVPEGKKSVMLRVLLGNGDVTLTS